MEITIHKCKSKLTKSYINQMSIISTNYDVIRTGRLLGYVLNIIKFIPRAHLIEYENRYYVLPSNYRKGEMSIYRRVGKYGVTSKFKSADDCNKWWETYEMIKRSNIEQIYI